MSTHRARLDGLPFMEKALILLREENLKDLDYRGVVSINKRLANSLDEAEREEFRNRVIDDESQDALAHLIKIWMGKLAKERSESYAWNHYEDFRCMRNQIQSGKPPIVNELELFCKWCDALFTRALPLLRQSTNKLAMAYTGVLLNSLDESERKDFQERTAIVEHSVFVECLIEFWQVKLAKERSRLFERFIEYFVKTQASLLTKSSLFFPAKFDRTKDCFKSFERLEQLLQENVKDIKLLATPAVIKLEQCLDVSGLQLPLPKDLEPTDRLSSLIQHLKSTFVHMNLDVAEDPAMSAKHQ